MDKHGFLYHGTFIEYAQDIVINGIKLYKSKDIVDFGKGFYTTDEYEFAIKTVLNKIRMPNYNKPSFILPAVVVLKFHESTDVNEYGLINHHLEYKEFDKNDNEWICFILQHRIGG